MNLKEKFKKREQESESTKNRLSLEKEIYNAGSIPNVVTAIVTVIYIIISTTVQLDNIVPFIVTAIFTCLILQGLVAPITNKLITQNLSDDLDSFYNYETDTKERTKLLKQLMACPAKIGLEVFLVFLIGGSIWMAFCNTNSLERNSS